MKTTVIIPTMNEEKAIVPIIKSISKKFEVVVIDKSTDKTPYVAKKAGAKVFRQRTTGKGSAMIEVAKKVKSDIIVFLDGDGTYPTNKISELVSYITKSNYDLVYGARRPVKGSMSLSHRFGNWVFRTIASVLYRPTTDLLTGMFAIKRDKFLELDLISKGFEMETEIFIKSFKNNLKIKEVPIPYYKRLGEKKINDFSDGFNILKMLISQKFK